jgi:CDP-diacylglycerol--serine O-phosphatidyltransferase
MFSIPNIITSLNLLLGCASAACAVNGNMAAAFWCVVAAAIADFLDGFAARLLRQYSEIGKQLDSLADVVSFGFAPAFMLYMAAKSAAFSVVELYPFLLTAFSALRLAKFNIDQRQTTSFIGLPTPANGLFFSALALMIVEEKNISQWNILAMMLLVLAFCYLLICELPMFSLKMKGFSLKKYGIRYVFLVISLLVLILFQVKGIPIIVGLYIMMSLILALFNKIKPNLTQP